eukprot:1160534-Pelagomonas_calceolata.AAC.2
MPSAAKEGKSKEMAAAAAAAAAKGSEAGPSAMEVEEAPKAVEPESGKEEKEGEGAAAAEGGVKEGATGGEGGPGEKKEGAEAGASAEEEASKEGEPKAGGKGPTEEAAASAAVVAAGAALAVFPTPRDGSAAFHMSASPFSLQSGDLTPFLFHATTFDKSGQTPGQGAPGRRCKRPHTTVIWCPVAAPTSIWTIATWAWVVTTGVYVLVHCGNACVGSLALCIYSLTA